MFLCSGTGKGGGVRGRVTVLVTQQWLRWTNPKAWKSHPWKTQYWSRERKTHITWRKALQIPQLGSTLKSLYVGVLFLENKGEEAHPHKELGSQIFMLGAPSILYVGILYVLLHSLGSEKRLIRLTVWDTLWEQFCLSGQSALIDASLWRKPL